MIQPPAPYLARPEPEEEAYIAAAAEAPEPKYTEAKVAAAEHTAAAQEPKAPVRHKLTFVSSSLNFPAWKNFP